MAEFPCLDCDDRRLTLATRRVFPDRTVFFEIARCVSCWREKDLPAARVMELAGPLVGIVNLKFPE